MKLKQISVKVETELLERYILEVTNTEPKYEEILKNEETRNIYLLDFIKTINLHVSNKNVYGKTGKEEEEFDVLKFDHYIRETIVKLFNTIFKKGYFKRYETPPTL